MARVIINVTEPVTGPIHTGSGNIVQSSQQAGQGQENAQNRQKPVVVVNTNTTMFHGPVTGQIHTGDKDIDV